MAAAEHYYLQRSLQSQLAGVTDELRAQAQHASGGGGGSGAGEGGREGSGRRRYAQPPPVPVRPTPHGEQLSSCCSPESCWWLTSVVCGAVERRDVPAPQPEVGQVARCNQPSK